MPFLDDLRWRGLVHQTTDDENLANWLSAKPRTVYAGFDPTGDSLHIGHLLGVLMLRRLQMEGHRPIALIGGATGMIGDPSGKNDERNLLDPETIARNITSISRQMERLLDLDSGDRDALVLNNNDWIGRYGYIEFLRDIGKNFPVNVMLAKESVKNRLGRGDVGLSYTEFSYMLLQAYDFVYLNQEYGCELQVGGSDQWGNITAGIDLARRMRGTQLFGMTWPLLTKEDGTKMGKTEAGAVWLSAERTSPYAFYQYWINLDDLDASRCLRMLTELPQAEIEALDTARAENPERRDSQRRLAEEMTRCVHGRAGLATAQRATEVLFGAEVHDLDDRQLLAIFADVPNTELPRSRLAGNGLNILDALCESGLAKSKSEARRTVGQGGAYLNNRRIVDIERQLTTADFASETVIVLRTGKKHYALLRFP
ncbi:MAG: tyrosine--tRNA ligase [Pirellulales bacterium]|nr:tyrosine--tRNA ligase [Pirellulales bacterium]